MSTSNSQLVAHAQRIWHAGLAAVRSDTLMRAAVEMNGSVLTIDDEPIDLDAVRRIAIVGGGKAGVLATEKFLAKKPKTAYATQSGPMLVIDGAIHPAFIVNSNDLKPRDGVGVSSATDIHFVISRGSVSFYEFARFFRDRLGVKNALFLDGGLAPGLYAPELKRNDPPAHGGYGPIVAVVK